MLSSGENSVNLFAQAAPRDLRDINFLATLPSQSNILADHTSLLQ
jgi:hypothetical protein